MFTEKEIAYLQSQLLARLATVSTTLQPDVAPVGFKFDGEKVSISNQHQDRYNRHEGFIYHWQKRVSQIGGR